MPPLGDLFRADDIEALWAYVMAGEEEVTRACGGRHANFPTAVSAGGGRRDFLRVFAISEEQPHAK
jgi:hypothetical protein